MVAKLYRSQFLAGHDNRLLCADEDATVTIDDKLMGRKIHALLADGFTKRIGGGQYTGTSVDDCSRSMLARDLLALAIADGHSFHRTHALRRHLPRPGEEGRLCAQAAQGQHGGERGGAGRV